MTTRRVAVAYCVGVVVLTAGVAARSPGPGPVAGAGRADPVTLVRTPGHGIQPQAAGDGAGTLHLIYFRGQDGAGDIFYVRSTDGGGEFSHPLRVNSQPGSAIATGNIRGAHLAVGKQGRAHVAWMGSDKAVPRAFGNAAPMLYSRLNDAGTAFEPQRNLIQAAAGLDGGGSVAADGVGNVAAAWHAPEPGTRGEASRRVWVALSSDEGRTFAREKPVSDPATGVCGCCGMRAFFDRAGGLYLLYRSAAGGVNRDTYLLSAKNLAADFHSDDLQQWAVGVCPMSSFALAEGGPGVLAAWETAGQVYFARLDPATGKPSPRRAAPGAGSNRKHPVVAANPRGETILAWTEGMGWNRGGSVAWQVFDRDGRPTAERGHADGVPTWSLVAVFTRADGGFTVVY